MDSFVKDLRSSSDFNPAVVSLRPDKAAKTAMKAAAADANEHTAMSDDGDEAAKAAAAADAGDDTADDTIFGKIVRKEIPCDIVFEDDLCLCFNDINPQAPVHMLLIPKERNGLTGISKAEDRHAAVLGHMMVQAGKLGSQHCPDGFRLVVNDGKEGCQSVYHLHIHILGGRQMAWPPG